MQRGGGASCRRTWHALERNSEPSFPVISLFWRNLLRQRCSSNSRISRRKVRLDPWGNLGTPSFFAVFTLLTGNLEQFAGASCDHDCVHRHRAEKRQKSKEISPSLTRVGTNEGYKSCRVWHSRSGIPGPAFSISGGLSPSPCALFLGSGNGSDHSGLRAMLRQKRGTRRRLMNVKQPSALLGAGHQALLLPPSAWSEVHRPLLRKPH
jgi:hypothetical protein